jgi:hypothetical protein
MSDWQKRHAIQIVAQLPEGKDDALRVLEEAKTLVESYLYSESEQGKLLRFSIVPESVKATG